MSKPYFDKIKSIVKLRREKSSMDKIIRAYNVLHNKDYDDNYQRNAKFAELLDDIKIIQPNVEKAIEEEKNIFLEHVMEIEKFYLEETGNPIRHLQLGGWWYELLERPKTLYLPGGAVQVEPANDWESNYTEGYGDGVCSSKSNDQIRVTLVGELTYKEALEKHIARQIK